MWKTIFAVILLAPIISMVAALYTYFGQVDFVMWYRETRNWQTGMGAYLGLLAILAGAMLNAELARKRDSDQMLRSARSTAAAIGAHLREIVEQTSRMAKVLPEQLRYEGTDFDGFGTFKHLTAIYSEHYDALKIPITEVGTMPTALIEATHHAKTLTRQTRDLCNELNDLVAKDKTIDAVNIYVKSASIAALKIQMAQQNLEHFAKTLEIKRLPTDVKFALAADPKKATKQNPPPTQTPDEDAAVPSQSETPTSKP